MGASWDLFWASWALGGLLGPAGGLGGPLGAEGSKCELEFLLLGPSWGHLGPSRAHLGPSWGYPGPSWGSLGGCLLMERVFKPVGVSRGPLGGLFWASWGPLGKPLWEHRSGCRRVASDSVLGASREASGAFGSYCHRAWVVGQRLLGYLLGSLGMLLGRFWSQF